MSQITNYSAMTDAELNTAEANALTALRMVKAERKRRAGTQRGPKQSVLPVSEIVAGRMRKIIENAVTRTEATALVQHFIVAHRLTVPQLRTLAKHWGIGVTSKMNKAQLIDLIVDMLVGHRLDSDAIRRL